MSSSSGKVNIVRGINSNHENADFVGIKDNQTGTPKRHRIKNQPCVRDDNLGLIPVEVGKEQPETAAVAFADDDDGFMSDCDPSPAPSPETSVEDDKPYKSRKVRSSPENVCPMFRKKRKTRARNMQNNEQEYDTLLRSANDDVQDEEDHVDAFDCLHPNFKNPKFGPYEPMEPLKLSNYEDGTTVQVPASLNRYLAPFQKEGVRFMYDCLARNSGVLLGDEMGCGKTVQVISLLCALFSKTGSKKDFFDVKRRNFLVTKHILQVQRFKDQALYMGEVVDENIEDWKTSLSLSPWHPVMIIVPPTILDTWLNAFKTFSYFSVLFYSNKTKIDAINSVLYGSTDILMVPKSAFQDKKHLDELKRVRWKLVVIDEFHNFKNYKAKISVHLRKLKQLHRPLILGMTGTPMQNNHTELWNLIDLIETNYFGTKDEFKINIDRPITLGRHKCADPRAKARSEAASSELRKGLSKIYIKREKKDVLKGQLPEKNEEFILCDLSPLQKEVYRHVVKLPDFDLVKHGSRPCDCGVNQDFFRKLLKLKGKTEQLDYMRKNKSKLVSQSKCCKKVPFNSRYGKTDEPFMDQDAAIWRTLDVHCGNDDIAKKGCDRCPWCCTLPCLTKLNKISSHLGLLQASTRKEGIGSPQYINYKKEREFAKVALAGVISRLPGKDYNRNNGVMDDHFNLSGKIKVLDFLLRKNYEEGGKALLFSHSTQSLDLIENWLKSRGSYEYRRMDGRTPLSKRQFLTDEFNNTDHIFLFLLSIKATGLGLNLTSANMVILFDVTWNPSWETQAQDRAHRIGQKRNVRVVRLISKGTIEEMIYLRQIYKEHLKQDTLQEYDELNIEAPRVFRGVQGDKYRKGELFGTENLFRFKKYGSFLYDIYDTLPESRSRGNGDSTCLEIHNSGKVSRILLQMSEEEKIKVKEEDDLVILQAMSDKISVNRPRFSPSSRSSHADESDEVVEQKIRAANHRDLFRSDRGGAAINSGEDGFDLEMGGQTQAAFEIYENIKGDLCKETKGHDDVLVHEDDNYSNDDKACMKDINQSISSSQKCVSEVLHSIDKESFDAIQTASPNPPIVAMGNQEKNGRNFDGGVSVLSSDGIKSDIVSNLSSAQQTSKNLPESNTKNNLTTTTHEGYDKQIDIRKDTSSIMRGNVSLMGCTDIKNVRTEFSAGDLRRPMYKRKKKKKSK
mmetsp:Transcript_3344/g.8920  ORF Transcript_3344/g.8920 Transcript_3344/m.8920 type:complete len:1185 (-) Transcript_3344:13-3567(-)